MSTTIGNYNDWIQSLQQKGINTTSLSEGEANFSDYGNALSTELQQEILDSFDSEADTELQAQIAALYTDGNVEDASSVIAKCEEMGIKVETSTVDTSYIVDNKADGNMDKDVTNGSVTVYTFSDGNGGEFKVADANGNGSLESEELFINEILTGVASDIAVDASNNVTGTSAQAGAANAASSGSSGDSVFDKLRNALFGEEETTGDGQEITSATFNAKVETLAQQYQKDYGMTHDKAYAKAEETVKEDYQVK